MLVGWFSPVKNNINENNLSDCMKYLFYKYSSNYKSEEIYLSIRY